MWVEAGVLSTDFTESSMKRGSGRDARPEREGTAGQRGRWAAKAIVRWIASLLPRRPAAPLPSPALSPSALGAVDAPGRPHDRSGTVGTDSNEVRAVAQTVHATGNRARMAGLVGCGPSCARAISACLRVRSRGSRARMEGNHKYLSSVFIRIPKPNITRTREASSNARTSCAMELRRAD